MPLLDDEIEMGYNFSMSEKKNYSPSLDLIRVISIFFVVVIHSASPLYNNWELPRADWMAGNIYNSIARASVPLLFMVSGYLLLSRSEDTLTFLKNRARKVLFPLIIWAVIYLVWSNHGYANYTPLNAAKAILYGMLNKPAHYHFWFMNVLLAIYLFVPVLRIFVRAADETTIRYFALVWLLFGPVLDILQQRVFNFEIAFNLGFFNQYFGYFYLGYVIGRFEFSRRASRIAGLVYLVLTVYTIYATYDLSQQRGQYIDFYHIYLRINMVIMSLCAFIWLKHIGANWQAQSGILRRLSSASFGIYLVHVMIISLLKWGSFGFRLDPASPSPFWMIPLFALTVYGISFLITALIQKIPYLRAIIPA